MRFAITGASGLVGSELTRYLRDAGHHVTPVVRSFGSVAHGQRAVVWHPERGVIEADNLEGHDVVIHLAGENIAGVWTQAKKRRILDSRVQGTTLLASTIAKLKSPPRALFSASGFNVYGNRPPGEVVTEESAPGTGFLADVARAWEGATLPARQAGVRVVIMRFGNVLSPRGGMIGALLPLYKLGLAAQMGSGEQVWPWIAAAEIPTALLHVLERPELSGPVNFVSPNPVSNAVFTDAFAAAVGRPSILRVPKFAAGITPGDMLNELLLAGARVMPKKLLDSGYEFRFPELRPALNGMLR